MIGDSDARGPAIESGEAGDRKFEGRSAMIATDRAGTKRILLGGVAALLLVAAAAYYFADRREGTDVAMRPSPESPPAVTAPRPPESAQNPAPSVAPGPSRPPDTATASPSTAPVPSSQPTSPQQSAAAAPSQDATPTPEPPAAPSATAAQNQTTVPPSEQSKQSAEAPKAEETSPPASASQQPSMRDQPAALPDQPAAAPKNETMLVIMRGPANIRSAPGKAGRIVGTVAKNATVKEVSRSGNWVEVETESGTGWIAATLLSPQRSQN